MLTHDAKPQCYCFHAARAQERGNVTVAPCAGGFTLVEMVVVITLIGIISAVALPQLMPVIVFSRGEGAARHLAGFGRSAMADVSIMRETITVKFDLDKQEYWAERLVIENKDEEGFFADEKDPKKGKGEFLNLMGKSNMSKTQLQARGFASEEEAAQAREAEIMRERLDRFVRTQIEARARKIDKGSLFEDMGPLFEKKFSLDSDSEIEEIKDPLLQRTGMPPGVKIETMRLGSTDHRSGLVEVELTADGLFEPILFYVKNEDEDFFTVAWDPLTGTARFEKGKKEAEDMGEKSKS